MTEFDPDDAAGRRLWAGAPRPPIGCPDDMALAAYIDRRADAGLEARVEDALANCRETSCLCLAVLAAALQPTLEPVRPEAVAAARALVAPRPLQRVGRLAQWAAAAAAVVLAAQLGFNLGMASATSGVQAQSEDASVSWADWSTSADL